MQAAKLQAGKAEDAARAASAAAVAELEAERRRGEEQARKAADLWACLVAERDLGAAARAAYVERLLREWTLAAGQVCSLPAQICILAPKNLTAVLIRCLEPPGLSSATAALCYRRSADSCANFAWRYPHLHIWPALDWHSRQGIGNTSLILPSREELNCMVHRS